MKKKKKKKGCFVRYRSKIKLSEGKKKDNKTVFLFNMNTCIRILSSTM